MSTALAVTMEELELERAELLPSRETLCCCSHHNPPRRAQSDRDVCVHPREDQTRECGPRAGDHSVRSARPVSGRCA